MSHLFLAKQLDGYAATFLRFTSSDNFVIEVNGEERTVTREFWCSLAEMKADERSAGHHSTITDGSRADLPIHAR